MSCSSTAYGAKKLGKAATISRMLTTTRPNSPDGRRTTSFRSASRPDGPEPGGRGLGDADGRHQRAASSRMRGSRTR